MLVKLPLLWVLALDISAWFFFHMTISLLLMKVPDDWFARTKGLFVTRLWEKEGELWDDWFHIRAWKKHLPDGSLIIKSAFDKTNLHGTDLDNLNTFILETKRAELTHWLLLFPAPLFFIWNPLWAGIVNVVYALLANIPFILSQRFNRPRLERLYVLKHKKSREEGHSHTKA